MRNLKCESFSLFKIIKSILILFKRVFSFLIIKKSLTENVRQNKGAII